MHQILAKVGGFNSQEGKIISGGSGFCQKVYGMIMRDAQMYLFWKRGLTRRAGAWDVVVVGGKCAEQ